MLKEITEKLDAIEATNAASIAAATEAISVAQKAATETVKTELTEKVLALEAKISTLGAPALIHPAKTVRGDVNKMVREQLKAFHYQMN